MAAPARPADAVLPELLAAIAHLASFERPSASDGERRAAEWIAERLREEGCAVRVEQERAHGGYWWPLGLLTGLAGAAALSGRRGLALAAGAIAAAGVYDDVSGGRLWFRRRFLPARPTWNVVAEAGEAGAEDAVVVVATLLCVARVLRERPVAGLRVLLVSTGSEESFMEGMQAFARRHFPALPPDRTRVIAVDTVGSPELVQLEGEGMIRMREYPQDFKDLVSACAAGAGVHLRPGLR